MTGAQPHFDDTREALSFALNLEGDVKAPTMSRLMSQVGSAPRRIGKAARRRFLRQYEHDADLHAFAVRLLDDQAAPGRRSPRPGEPMPRGLDAAHLAGWILAHFARIEEHRQDILVGRVRSPGQRCACGSPCCSGWRRDARWARAVVRTCEHVAAVGNVTREPGKRGASSRPEMRVAMVEQFFLGADQTLVELARLGLCSLTTAARHRDWIVGYLGQEEDNAWAELALLFDQAGITGPLA